MSEQLLQVRNLSVSVEDKPILHGIDLEVRPGETHVLMGPNGAGKSTLGYTIMGSPRYEVTGGEILFKGKELLEETADQRAKDGIFLSFQNPLEVPGVSLRNFIRNAVEQRSGSRIKLWTFKKELEKAMEVLQMDPSYGDRDLNVGFSGGEKKRFETLQMALLKPEFCILDEIDSGLDIDALKTVSDGVNSLRSPQNAFLVITHYQRLLNHIVPDVVHIFADGRIIKTGDSMLAQQLEKSGYADFLKGE